MTIIAGSVFERIHAPASASAERLTIELGSRLARASLSCIVSPRTIRQTTNPGANARNKRGRVIRAAAIDLLQDRTTAETGFNHAVFLQTIQAERTAESNQTANDNPFCNST